MTYVRLFLVAACAVLLPSLVTASDLRFSKTLSPSERTETGLDRLSSDQTAVLDALVRRDRSVSHLKSRPQSDLFTERLLDDERRNAGIELLKSSEIERLNALVQLHRSLSVSPPPFVSRSRVSTDSRIRPEMIKEKPDIRGTYSIWFGGGSGGYSERGASISSTYTSPSGQLSVTVGYATVRTKGPSIYRDDFVHSPSPFEPTD